MRTASRVLIFPFSAAAVNLSFQKRDFYLRLFSSPVTSADKYAAFAESGTGGSMKKAFRKSMPFFPRTAQEEAVSEKLPYLRPKVPLKNHGGSDI